MRGGTNSRGYTIVEVMIFLAISGLMFVMSAAFVTGKQSKVEFKQGINTINSDMSAIINQVGDGYFPSARSFSCSAPAGNGAPVLDKVHSSSQGSNIGCVFMGKIVEFTADGVVIHSVAGRQYAQNGAGSVGPPISFAKAEPNAVDSLNETIPYHFGLKMTKVRNNGSVIAAVGFFTGFGKYDGAGTDALYQAGSGIVTTAFAALPADGNGAAYDSAVVAAPNVTACFDSGAGQFGTLTIGGQGTGQRLAVKTQIYGTKAEQIAGSDNACI